MSELVPAADAAAGEVVAGPEPRTGLFGVTGSGDTSGFGGLVRVRPAVESAQRPLGSYFDHIVDTLIAALAVEGVAASAAITQIDVAHEQLGLGIAAEHLLVVARVLRDHPELRFELCSSVSGVHYPEQVGAELHAVYQLLSITHNRRVRLEATCADADPRLPSLVEIYPTADWQERETWDFFGLVFTGHPALTRIQMPDDWPGHPQRKDYPLGGIAVQFKGASIPAPDNRRSYN